MAACDVCGNEYDKSFTVIQNRQHYTFDSFECAIQLLAPLCAHCECKIIGHGVETDTHVYCCAHCATSAGSKRLQDRSSEAT
jgi:hypothetical protein